MDPITLALVGGGLATSLLGQRHKAPQYTPSPQYTDITFGTLYPHLKDIIQKGGIGFDTTGLERRTSEDIASRYGGAYRNARAFTAPYGNITAGNRMASNIGTQQAQETSRAITGIRGQSEAEKIQTLMTTLGMVGGLQDPALAAYHANLGAYGLNQQNQQQTASMLGDLASLYALYQFGSKLPVPATAATTASMAPLNPGYGTFNPYASVFPGGQYAY